MSTNGVILRMVRPYEIFILGRSCNTPVLKTDEMKEVKEHELKIIIHFLLT